MRMSLLLWLIVGVVGAIAFVIGEMVKVAIKEEYAGWGADLARSLVWLAGKLDPSRRGQMQADLAYEQRRGDLRFMKRPGTSWDRSDSSHAPCSHMLTGPLAEHLQAS
jgi:hypothetical protein